MTGVIIFFVHDFIYFFVVVRKTGHSQENVLAMPLMNFFPDGFTKLVHHWQKHVQLSGDYVQRECMEIKGKF